MKKLAAALIEGRCAPAYATVANADGSYNPLSGKHLQVGAVQDALRTCPIISVDNVAEYFCGKKQSMPHDVKDFLFEYVPSLAPPFSEFWVEARFPGLRMTSQSAGVNDASRGHFGVFFKTRDLLSDPHTIPGFVQGARWLLESALFLEIGNIATGPILSAAVWVDADGKVMEFRTAYHPKRNLHMLEQLASLMCTAWLAISFMHCKNVSVREERVPDKLVKASSKRNRPMPLVRWYVLEIEPMTKILRAGKGEGSDVKQALHICRGHFKDYRQSGLFGKIKGLFWWDSTVRGSAKQGVVVKDYAVSPPSRT